MKRFYPQLSAATLAILLGATAVLQACGADDPDDPVDPEDLGSYSMALTSTNTRFEIDQHSLDRLASVVKAEQTGSACGWKVSGASFRITPSGVRLRGAVRAHCLAYSSSPVSGLSTKPITAKAVALPTPSPARWEPVGAKSFDLPVTVTYRDGYLRLEASHLPVHVTRYYTGKTLYRLDLSPYFSTKMYVANTLFNTERATFEAAADNVSVALLDGRIRVTSRVTIN